MRRESWVQIPVEAECLSERCGGCVVVEGEGSTVGPMRDRAELAPQNEPSLEEDSTVDPM